jgi:two-component system, LytTR family, sensor kinase
VILFALILITPALAAASVWSPGEKVAAVAMPLTGLALAFLVNRFVRRTPWPRPFRFRFAVLHAVAAVLAAGAWVLATSALVAVFAGRDGRDGSWEAFIVIGVICYTIVAGVSYAVEATARAARAEALAARTQLAALRAQIHPHFLFNSLHTIVQLIPIEPARAAEAAELVADLLRTTVEEQRDEVPLGDEWRFVSRYLSVERIRFGDRLVVRAEMPDDLLDDNVPSFALQTLVENAVQHGAAPRAAPTEIVVKATATRSELTLSVRNTGNSGSASAAKAGPGTGLARLRDRLTVLYGGAARLTVGPTGDARFEAVLVVPRSHDGHP